MDPGKPHRRHAAQRGGGSSRSFRTYWSSCCSSPPVSPPACGPTSVTRAFPTKRLPSWRLSCSTPLSASFSTHEPRLGSGLPSDVRSGRCCHSQRRTTQHPRCGDRSRRHHSDRGRRNRPGRRVPPGGQFSIESRHCLVSPRPGADKHTNRSRDASLNNPSTTVPVSICAVISSVPMLPHSPTAPVSPCERLQEINAKTPSCEHVKIDARRSSWSTASATSGATLNNRAAWRTVSRRPGISLYSPCTRTASGVIASGAPPPLRDPLVWRSLADVVI